MKSRMVNFVPRAARASTRAAREVAGVENRKAMTFSKGTFRPRRSPTAMGMTPQEQIGRIRPRKLKAERLKKPGFSKKAAMDRCRASISCTTPDKTMPRIIYGAVSRTISQRVEKKEVISSVSPQRGAIHQRELWHP